MPKDDSGTEKKMSLWSHVEELRKCIFRIILVVVGIAAFCMIFDLRSAEVGGVQIIYPYPDMFHTISTRVFLKISADLLPPTVTLIALAPWDAFIVQMQIAIVLGVSIGMPFIIYEMGKFLGPALRSRERQLIFRLTLPSSILFLGGCVFAYLVIVPFSVKFLYQFAYSMGIAQMFTVTQFISFTLMMTFAFGIVAEIPVVIVGLSSLKLVSPAFWWKHWRWAFMGSFLFAAIITPDGTGITMTAIAVPMMALYFTGCTIAGSSTKMLTIGLILGLIGAVAALGSFLHDVWRIRLGGESYDSLGWVNWVVVMLGIVIYAAGMLLYILSMKRIMDARNGGESKPRDNVAPQP